MGVVNHPRRSKRQPIVPLPNPDEMVEIHQLSGQLQEAIAPHLAGRDLHQALHGLAVCMWTGFYADPPQPEPKRMDAFQEIGDVIRNAEAIVYAARKLARLRNAQAEGQA